MAISEFEPQTEGENLADKLPGLTLITGGLAVENAFVVGPDVSSMSPDNFRDHVHGLSQTGEDAPAILDSLLKVDGQLLSKSHELNHELAELTVKAMELSRQLEEAHARRRLVQGYIKDRQ